MTIGSGVHDWGVEDAASAVTEAASYAALAATSGSQDGQWAATVDDGEAYRWTSSAGLWLPASAWAAGLGYLTGDGGADLRVLLADAAVPTWGTPSGAVAKSAGVPLTLGASAYIEGTPLSEGSELDEVVVLVELGAAPTGYAALYLYEPNGGGTNSGLSIRLSGTGAPALDAYTASLIGAGSTQGSLGAGSWLIARASWRSADDNFTLRQPGTGGQRRGALATRAQARTLGARYFGLIVDGAGSLSVRQLHVLNLGG